MSLKLEPLSDRTLPSTVHLFGTTLVVLGDADAPNTVTVDPADKGQVRVLVNGTTNVGSFSSVVVVGGSKADDVSNNTSADLTAFGLGGNDRFIGGTGTNLISGGTGSDLLYSLLGDTTLESLDGELDRVYSSAGSTVYADGLDRTVTFFDKGRTVGSGKVELDAGVLYLTPTKAGSSTRIDEVGGLLFVTYDFGSGQQVQVFDRASVRTVAFFGAGGNDTFVNNSSVEEAAYGAGGTDTIVSGFGEFNLLKGSGGADTLLSRGKTGDLSGNGGPDALLGFGAVTFRFDGQDTLLPGPDDRLVGS
jgi:hypothetical protein